MDGLCKEVDMAESERDLKEACYLSRQSLGSLWDLTAAVAEWVKA